MRRLNISHVTEYLFSGPVALLPHRLLLRPRENHNVRIESSILEIFPRHTVQWKRDVLDNSVAVVGFPEPSDRLRITSNVVIQHYEENPFDFLVDDYAVIHPFDYAIEEQADLAPFREAVYPADREAVQRWLGGLGLQRPMETFTLLDRVNREIAGRFFYQMREEPGVQPPAQTLAHNSGYGTPPGSRTAGGRQLHRAARSAPVAECGGEGERAPGVNAVHKTWWAGNRLSNSAPVCPSRCTASVADFPAS